jgi:hypothetical protein
VCMYIKQNKYVRVKRDELVWKRLSHEIGMS